MSHSNLYCLAYFLKNGIAVLRRAQESTQSAEGAQYKSQGQARSEAERVAPGYIIKFRVALKKGVIPSIYSGLSGLTFLPLSRPGATRSASLRASPLDQIIKLCIALKGA